MPLDLTTCDCETCEHIKVYYGNRYTPPEQGCAVGADWDSDDSDICPEWTLAKLYPYHYSPTFVYWIELYRGVEDAAWYLGFML